jgi:hypothetical protein
MGASDIVSSDKLNMENTKSTDEKKTGKKSNKENNGVKDRKKTNDKP